MSKRKDYIGPTIRSGKPAIIPEGPAAEFNPKSSKGMRAAGKELGKVEEHVEGVIVEAPFRMGPPLKLPPSLKNKIAKAQKAVEEKQRAEAEIDPALMRGNSHIGSIENVLKNDRMEKPRITAWKDDDPDSTKPK